MQLSALDLSIIFGYIVLTIVLGMWVSKLASRNLRSYFLAGNKLPWWVLGLSNASGMFDVAGTMWMVGLMVVYGVKSLFIPWVWPVFNQIFLMMFLAVWLRRSEKLTGAEWISFRFGEDGGARAARASAVAGGNPRAARGRVVFHRPSSSMEDGSPPRDNDPTPPNSVASRPR